MPIIDNSVFWFSKVLYGYLLQTSSAFVKGKKVWKCAQGIPKYKIYTQYTGYKIYQVSVLNSGIVVALISIDEANLTVSWAAVPPMDTKSWRQENSQY